MDLIDEIATVSSEDSIARIRKLTKDLGLMVGISSGANILAAENYIEKHQPEGITISILCDRQERYFSLLNDVQ